MSSNPKFGVPGGSTPVPNWLFDSKVLTANEKLVAWGFHRSAYRSDTRTSTGIRHIASKTGLDRRTVKAVTARLCKLKVITPKGQREVGYAQMYELALTPPDGLGRVNTTPTPGSVQHPLVGQYNTHIKSSKTNQEDASAPEGSSLRDAEATSGEDGLGHSAGSAASPESALPSNIEVSTASRLHGIGAAELATHPGRNGRNTLQSSDIADEILNEAFGEPTPQRQYTKREINDLLLTPEGLRVSSNRDDLEYDLQNEVLPMLAAEYINDRALAKLIELRGVGFCQLWQHWLPRKVASYYEKGESVDKPTGLYIEAVREGWEVDPAWPQFDEELHTVAARAEARKRQEARGPKAPVPGTSYTQNDVNRFADEVLSGERNLIYLSMQLQGPVRTRLDELHDAQAEAEEIPF